VASLRGAVVETLPTTHLNRTPSVWEAATDVPPKLEGRWHEVLRTLHLSPISEEVEAPLR
jgi:hypothetical protein